MNRYYWSRQRTGSYQGQFRICDRLLDTWIAHCQFKEAAELITGALNHQSSLVKDQTAKVQTNEPVTLAPSTITITNSDYDKFLHNNPSKFHAPDR